MNNKKDVNDDKSVGPQFEFPTSRQRLGIDLMQKLI